MDDYLEIYSRNELIEIGMKSVVDSLEELQEGHHRSIIHYSVFTLHQLYVQPSR